MIGVVHNQKGQCFPVGKLVGERNRRSTRSSGLYLSLECMCRCSQCAVRG